MLFSPLDRNGSVKRQRETPFVEQRPLKKSSPVPSEIGVPIAEPSHKGFGISTPIKDVIRKCSGIRYSPNRKREDHRRQPKRGLGLCAADPNSLITPDASPLRAKNGAYWEAKRIQSTGHLAISSPILQPRVDNQSLSEDFADLSLSLAGQKESLPSASSADRKTHDIFQMKEILENILTFVNFDSDIPHEKSCSRRRPLSYNHALLIYKDAKKASQAWKESQESMTADSTVEEQGTGRLYNCLVVNRLWHSVTLELLLKKVYFKDHNHYGKFIDKYAGSCATQVSKPSVFVLHKIHRLLQTDLEKITDVLAPENISWLEFYICPNIIPPLSWITKFQSLEKLILPGNKVIDDNALFEISAHVPKLKVLDLRACDNITDSGVVAVALRCFQLKSCNLGRHRNGNKITSLSVIALGKHTQIETLGVAGCDITDAGIWELAQLRGTHIKRLSLNNCHLLTNNSIPTLFAFNYFPNLSVLEIRHIEHINDLRQLARYKLWKKSHKIPILIEGCERITKLLHHEEAKIKRARLVMALQDMDHWVNKDDEQ